MGWREGFRSPQRTNWNSLRLLSLSLPWHLLGSGGPHSELWCPGPLLKNTSVDPAWVEKNAFFKNIILSLALLVVATIQGGQEKQAQSLFWEVSWPLTSCQGRDTSYQTEGKHTTKQAMGRHHFMTKRFQEHGINENTQTTLAALKLNDTKHQGLLMNFVFFIRNPSSSNYHCPTPRVSSFGDSPFLMTSFNNRWNFTWFCYLFSFSTCDFGETWFLSNNLYLKPIIRLAIIYLSWLQFFDN